MKTCIIDMYHILGTRSGMAVRLMYRGKVIAAWSGHASESKSLLGGAISRARREGFTHWRKLGESENRSIA